MDPTWTYVVFTDTVRSTEASKTVRTRHLEVVKQALEEGDQHLRLIDGRYVRRVGDEHKAEFADPWRAIEAALRVHNRTRALKDGLMERIGLDAGPSEEAETANVNVEEASSDRYQTVARAKRIMEICPGGYTLCSEDLLDCLEKSKRDALEVHGPLFVKLRGVVRPIFVYFVGRLPLYGLEMWQVGRPGPRQIDTISQISSGGTSEIIAALLVAPVFRLFRDTGRYQLGKLCFSILNKMSRWLKWLRLEIHSSIGLSDTTMLLQQPKESLQWAKCTIKLAHRISDKIHQAMADYQLGHRIAHIDPTIEAESYFRRGYARFEDLGEARMAGWSALYLGRCLRGLGRIPEAEDWILASLVIFVSAGGQRVRPISYALIQMARLRAVQGRFYDVQWYLDQARRLYPNAIEAPGDALWEDPLHSIQHQVANWSGNVQLATTDPASRLVRAILASLGLEET